jgi:hypothetical protein
MVLYVLIGSSQKRTIQYWSSGSPVFIFIFFLYPLTPFMYCAFVCLQSMYNEYTIIFFILNMIPVGEGGVGGGGVLVIQCCKSELIYPALLIHTQSQLL